MMLPLSKKLGHKITDLEVIMSNAWLSTQPVELSHFPNASAPSFPTGAESQEEYQRRRASQPGELLYTCYLFLART